MHSKKLIQIIFITSFIFSQDPEQLLSQGESKLASGDIDEAELLCERVGIINNGKLIAEDTVPNLKSSINKSKLEDVFLELTGRTLND